MQIGLKAFSIYYSALKKRDKVYKSLMKESHWKIMWPSPVIYAPDIRNTMIEMVVQWALVDQVPIYTDVYNDEQKVCLAVQSK